MNGRPPDVFGIKSWNARALLTRDRNLRMKKIAQLRTLFHSADVIALQEVHGEEGEIQSDLFEQVVSAHLFINPGSMPYRHFSRHKILVPGRAHAVTYRHPEERVQNSIVNVHNHELT